MAIFWQSVFWIALAGIAYTYVGYAALIALLAHLRPRPTRSAEITPTVTLIVAAYNEREWLSAKIENTLALDYPPDRLDLLIVTDGSDDGSDALVGTTGLERVRLLHQPVREGKSAALRRAYPHARGEVLVFSDANALLAPETVRRLVRHFADPSVGGVSGAKHIRATRTAGQDGREAVAQGEGLYWRYEAWLKRCDSAVSSVMGAPGEVWAVRRDAYRPPEANILLDDFVSSMRLVEDGWRVLYEPEAVACEEPSPGLWAEWHRRTRNAAGGWQAVVALRHMLWHRHKLLAWQYVSHRVLRWTVAPWLFILLAVANIALSSIPLYTLCGVAQLVFYLAAVVGGIGMARGRRLGWLTAPFYLCLLNAAALVGGGLYLSGRQNVLWAKVR